MDEGVKNYTQSNRGKREGRQAKRQAARQAGRKGRQGLRKANAPSNKGKPEGAQWETRRDPREGGHPTMGDTRRQDPWEGGHHPTKERHWETTETRRQGEKRFQEADTPSNKGKQEGRQGETRPWESGHTIQQRAAKGQDSREGGHTIQKRETRRGTMEDNKILGNPDTLSNKGKQELVKWETKRQTRPSGIRTRHLT